MEDTMYDWKEKKDREKKFWDKIEQINHQSYLELKEWVEKTAWLEKQKRENPTLFKD